MVVMESVGAQWLGAYGAPYRNSAVIEQLAERGALFSRAYASAPNSSSAMASLFSSVYPFHGLQTIPRVYPNFGVPGLPRLFTTRGYRTALIHGGTLGYDDNRSFLERQGFAELFDDSASPSLYTSSDVGTLAQAQWWLDKSAAQPFFLVVWTNQTHFPYHNDQSVGFGTRNERLERYLNGVLAADRLIGELIHTLERLGVADDTIVIVTGDHGETFGLHGKFAHGFEIYEEEMWVPLVIVAPGLPRQAVRTPVRQIDLAPTVLGMLGYDIPIEWQGVDLTTHTPPPRAYLFTGWSDLTFGLVENERKSIFHFPAGTSELYDLRTDPTERHNLAATESGRAELERSRERIDAWIRFQNTYLATFARPTSGVTNPNTSK
jgi:arylsulfatase A-like enzyme